MPSPVAQVRNAAKKDDLPNLKAVLRSNPQMAGRALFQAAQYGRYEIADWLVDSFSALNYDEMLVTALMPRATIPTRPGHFAVAQKALELGADPDARGGWNHDSALMWAAAGGFADMVDLLIQRGASIGLNEAAALGDLKRVRRRLKKDPAAVGEADAAGMLPLHCCARSALGLADANRAAALAQTAEALIDAGAQVQAPSIHREEKTFNPCMGPLNWAASSGNAAVVKVLLAYGAEVDSIGEWGTPLSQSVLRFPAIAETLFEHGADPNLRIGEDGAAALHAAANFPHPTSVAWLLAHGADPNLRLKDGRTPLHRAAERNASARVPKMLVEAGAALNPRDASGLTPLAYARQKKKTKVAEYLRGVGGVE